MNRPAGELESLDCVYLLAVYLLAVLVLVLALVHVLVVVVMDFMNWMGEEADLFCY